ncbi:NAD(P)-dependent alcohol dehydrogenase [Actinotalea ferrariae]|nr:NAD(P)-dependent alcohol dehydrogenase [Actinotalea ferrariae]
MRAAVHHRFGGPEVVGVESVPRPVPGPRDLLVRVHASDVSVADHRMRARDLPRGFALVAPFLLGLRAPRRTVLGMEAAGVVEAVGAEVRDYRPGDRVAAATGAYFGGHAEYALVRADQAVTRVPDDMGFEDAVALVFGGATAMAFLRAGRVGPGSEVLVNGASGAVGVMAVQLAKHLGARVTGVCSGRNVELVRSLGADVVVDHEIEDFAARGETYDVVVECVGNASFRRVRPLIRPGGSLLVVVGALGDLLLAPWRRWRSGIRVVGGDLGWRSEDLALLVRLADEATIRPVVDRTYGLDDVVEAHRYVDTGRKRGAVVLRVRDEAPTA